MTRRVAFFYLSFLSVIASSSIFINNEFCINYYPYTYHKCLEICSTDLDPTCLDDQLCFCNPVANSSLIDVCQNIPKRLSRYELENMAQTFGVEDLSNCEDSKFCSNTCQDIETRSFTKGILCSSIHDTSVKSCVCGI